jgi:hypothetical protein
MRAPRRALAILCVLALLSVAACRPSLEFSPATLPDAQVGTPYSATITVQQAATPIGDAYVSAGALPTGIELQWSKEQDNTTIRLVGTPSAAGTFKFTVSVWCLGTNVSGQTGDQEYTIVVK